MLSKLFSVKVNMGSGDARRQLVCVLVSSALLFVSFPGWAINFSQAYEKLLENNLSYRRAQLDFKAEKTLIAQARANLLPSVEVSGSTGYVRNDIENLEDPEADPVEPSEFDGESRRREEYAIRLRQPIYNREFSTRFKQAKSRVLESELRLQRVLEEQLVSLSDNYFGYLRSTANMRIAQRELTSVNEHRLLTVERQEIGLGTMADVHEAVSRYKIAQVELLDDIKAKELFADRLKRLLQLKGDVIAVQSLNSGVLSHPPQSLDIQQLITSKLEDNIEVELQRQILASAKLAMRLDRASHLPTIDLTASSGRSETEALEVGDELSTRDERVMLEINIPLFSGFGKSAKAKESRYRAEAEQLELENTIVTQSERIAEAYRSKVTAFKKMQALEESFRSADNALQLRKEGYLEGIVTSLDVLNAYRDKHRAERSLNVASFEYLTEIIRLNVALGDVDVDDIRKMDRFLANYSQEKEGLNDKSTVEEMRKVISLKAMNEKKIYDFIRSWENAWEAGDVKGYLGFYDDSFQPMGRSFDAWRASRFSRISPEKGIDLRVSDISIQKMTEKGKYEVSFLQNYQAKHYSDQSMKTLVIVREKDTFTIVEEKTI